MNYSTVQQEAFISEILTRISRCKRIYIISFKSKKDIIREICDKIIKKVKGTIMQNQVMVTSEGNENGGYRGKLKVSVNFLFLTLDGRHHPCSSYFTYGFGK